MLDTHFVASAPHVLLYLIVRARWKYPSFCNPTTGSYSGATQLSGRVQTNPLETLRSRDIQSDLTCLQSLHSNSLLYWSGDFSGNGKIDDISSSCLLLYVYIIAKEQISVNRSTGSTNVLHFSVNLYLERLLVEELYKLQLLMVPPVRLEQTTYRLQNCCSTR